MGISGLMSQIQTNTRKCPNKHRRVHARLLQDTVLLLFRAAPQHFIGQPPAQLTYAEKLFFHIRAHPMVQPVYDLPEALTLVKLYYSRLIFSGHLHAG